MPAADRSFDRDADGDSEMLSDSSSSQEANNGGQTPTRKTAAAATAAPDLSPPQSQDAMAVDPSNVQGFYPGMQGGPGEASMRGNGNGNGEEDTKAASTTAATGQKMTRAQKEYLNAEPGSGWRNKRAQEEYQRALEHVVDRDFNLGEFGDPFDERDMEVTTK